jgi:hypothetical protein
MTAVKTAVGQQSAKGGQTAPATPAPAPSGGAAPVASVPGVGDVPPAATPIAPVSAPVLGQTMAVAPAHGNVQIRLPGSSAYVPLGAAGSIPSGAIVDARSGTIVLSTAIDASGATQTAKLWGAVFQVRQSAAGKGMTDLVVRDRPHGCRGAAPAARAASVTPRRKRSTAGLWAQDSHGRFRSRGRNSVATVRGTRWLTRETCAGTLTQVTEGAVAVRDLRRHRTVTVRAGGRYLAKTAG